jgi:hypothetical protein
LREPIVSINAGGEIKVLMDSNERDREKEEIDRERRERKKMYLDSIT